MQIVTFIAILAVLAISVSEVSARRQGCQFVERMTPCAQFSQQQNQQRVLPSSNRAAFNSLNVGSAGDRLAAAKAFMASVYSRNRGHQGAAGFQADAGNGNRVAFDVFAENKNATCARYNNMPADPAQQRHAAFLAPSGRTYRRADKARRLRCITEELTTQCGLSYSEMVSNFGRGRRLNDALGVSNGTLGVDCALVEEDDEHLDCSGMIVQRIRSINGTCNNLRHNIWGSVETIFERLLDPVYDDGIGELKSKSPTTGTQLPNGRVVSTCTSPIVNNLHPWMSQAGALFGQFMTHDLVLTPTAKVDNTQTPPKCCGVPKECLHDDCVPIPIPADDESFSRFGKTCMEFVRSIPALEDTCHLGRREQLNQETHFLDLSVVYGGRASIAEKLRARRDGLLLTNDAKAPVGMGGGSNELLPPANDTGNCKKSENNGRACFLSGDPRTNVQPVLLAYHTVYFRTHNTIARGLKLLADQQGFAVNDEALFQTARKILIAMNQNIVYNEFLPIILGESVMSDPNLKLKLCGKDRGARPPFCTPDGHFTGYSEAVTPQIIQGFSTAAFRLHTLVPDELMFPDHTEHLGDNFFNPKLFYETDATTNALAGATQAPCQFYDQKLVRSLRDELFRKPTDSNGLGLDLLTLNIYRGRDHGLPGYNFYREFCHLGRARSWADLRSTMSSQSISALQCAYKNVDDIDPYAGMIAETPAGDGVVGPTASCIIREQFFRLRAGDRFWFENPDQFDAAQLREIHKTLLSSLICLTTGIKQLQPRSMMLRSKNKESHVPCAALLNIDLNVFLPILREFASLTGSTQTARQGTFRQQRPVTTNFGRNTFRPVSTPTFFPTKVTRNNYVSNPRFRFPSIQYTSRIPARTTPWKFYKSGKFSPFELSKSSNNLNGRSVSGFSPRSPVSTSSSYRAPYHSAAHFRQIISPRSTIFPRSSATFSRTSAPVSYRTSYSSARPVINRSYSSFPSSSRTSYSTSSRSSVFPSSARHSYSSPIFGRNLGPSWSYAGNLYGRNAQFASRALPTNWVVQTQSPYASYWHPPMVGRTLYRF